MHGQTSGKSWRIVPRDPLGINEPTANAPESMHFTCALGQADDLMKYIWRGYDAERAEIGEL
jgi:hypothetical protein